jgi:hypothetical protein
MADHSIDRLGHDEADVQQRAQGEARPEVGRRMMMVVARAVSVTVITAMRVIMLMIVPMRVVVVMMVVCSGHIALRNSTINAA